MAEAKAMIFIRIDSKLLAPFNGLFGITFEPEQPANDFQALQKCFYSMVPDSLEKLKTNLAFNIAMLLVSVMVFIALFEGGCVLVERFVSFLRRIVRSRNAALENGLKISSNLNNDKLLTICIPARKKFENIGLRGLPNVAVKSIAKPSLKLPCEPFLLPADTVVFLQTGFPINGPRVHFIITSDMFEIFLAHLERNVLTKANALLTKVKQRRVQDRLAQSPLESPTLPLRLTESSQNIKAVSKSPQQVFIHCTIQPAKSSVKRPITQSCSSQTINLVKAQSLSVASQTFQFVVPPIPTQTIRKCFMPARIQTVNPILKSVPTQTSQSVGKPASTQTSISTTAPVFTQTIGHDSKSSLAVSTSTQTFQRPMLSASQTSKSAGITLSTQTVAVVGSPVSTQTTQTQPDYGHWNPITDTGTLQKRQSATTFTQTIFGTVRMLPALKPRSKFNKGTQTTTLPARAGTSKKVNKTDKSSVVAKRLRPVLSKSHVVVTSYPGSDEIGGFLDPEHEYWLQKWSKRKHPFVKIPKFSNDDIIKAINKLPNEEIVGTTPTEEDWERYYQEELAKQAKEDAQRLQRRAYCKRQDINSLRNPGDTTSKDPLLVVDEIMKSINQLPKKKHVRQPPTEEDWERYYQEELAQQAKEDAQRLAKKARSKKSPQDRSSIPSKLGEIPKTKKLAAAGSHSKLRTPNPIKTTIKVSTSQLTAVSSSHKAPNGSPSKLCPPRRLKAPNKIDSSSKLRAPTNHKVQMVVKNESKMRQPSKLERPVSKRCASNYQTKPKDLSDALKMVPKSKSSPISESLTVHVPKLDKKKEEDWMASMQRALTREKLFRIQDDPEHRCTSSSVVGKMRKPTRMRRTILEEVDFLDEIKELAEPFNLVPCVSGGARRLGKIQLDDSRFFDLEPQLLDLVDEFPDDLPLITNEDIRQLCDRTPQLHRLTDADEQEVEAWLYTCNIPKQLQVDPLMF